jgi:hypothetical protein
MVVMFGDDILLDSDAIERPRLIEWFGGRIKLTGLMYVRSGEQNVEIIISRVRMFVYNMKSEFSIARHSSNIL